MSNNTQLAEQNMVNLDIALEHGLSESEYNEILRILNRDPNLLELGVFSVMWSEHCSYKSTRLHLKKLPTKADWVICGPGENAGIIDIGDNKAAIFKMESHNHPSFIEPYQGAGTGVGGILRDVFTMGARPVAIMNLLRFGDLSHPKTKHLLSGVVAGIGGYGNPVGVPTVGGETSFHSAYNGNNLVNAMVVGIADQDKIFYSAASKVGSAVVYVGSKTGRDGIHGATMASAEFAEGSEEKRPTVQVGDPFTEKLLIEACLELMATDAILAIQDMGAAGLTSSTFEMAGKGGTGIELDLSKVPTREEGMIPYEIMLSESQERMLMILKPEKEDLARKIFEKWDLDFAVIGTVTDTGEVVLKFKGEEVARLPVAPLSDNAPIYDRPYEIVKDDKKIHFADLSKKQSLEDSILQISECSELASKAWIWQQYDSQVMNDTMSGPGSSDAGIVRIHDSKKALAISTDCNSLYVKQDPVMGGRQAVAECWRNLTAVGAKPLAITNCLNFGNPERKEIMGQLVGALQGISESCIALSFPVISGNVSLYNETSGQAILPTPAIGGVGIISDIDLRISSYFDQGQTIILIGETKGEIGASLYLKEIHGREEGSPPFVDLEVEKRNGDFVRSLIENKQLKACHDLSSAGLIGALIDMSIKKEVGCELDIKTNLDLEHFLFAEDQARYLASIDDANYAEIERLANAANVPLTKIGTTKGDKLKINNQIDLSVKTIKSLNENFLANYMSK